MNNPTQSEGKAWLMYPTWLGYSETMELQLPAEAYTIEPGEGDERWVCRDKATGVARYNGIGPIRIVNEPIPF